MKHVILPPLHEYGPADLREGRAASAIVYNAALRDAGEAIKRAGGTYSHQISVYSIHLSDGLRVDTYGCRGLGSIDRLKTLELRRERLKALAELCKMEK